MTHIVASDGFGRMVHAHPHTGEKWTPETVQQWRRRCAGRDRAGGVWITVKECDCEEWDA